MMNTFYYTKFTFSCNQIIWPCDMPFRIVSRLKSLLFSKYKH